MSSSQFLIGDGQVSLGNQIIKPNARKVRQLKEGVICGFAGATADAMTLFERLEMKLQEHPETLRACVEMAKAWRMDKYLRRLEAIMIVCDANVSLTLTGNGDVIEPVDGVIGIGSGGLFATAAARALLDVEGMDAEAVGRKAMTIAADSARMLPHTHTHTLLPHRYRCLKHMPARTHAALPFSFSPRGSPSPSCTRVCASPVRAAVCVFTNHNFIEMSIDVPPKKTDAEMAAESAAAYAAAKAENEAAKKPE